MSDKGFSECPHLEETKLCQPKECGKNEDCEAILDYVNVRLDTKKVEVLRVSSSSFFIYSVVVYSKYCLTQVSQDV